jgi:hypothetical protein
VGRHGSIPVVKRIGNAHLAIRLSVEEDEFVRRAASRIRVR